MNDPTSAAWEELEEAFRQRGAELTRLRAQQTVLVEALQRAREYVDSASYATSATDIRSQCVECIDKALAALDVPEGEYDLRETVDRLRALDVPDTKEEL